MASPTSRRSSSRVRRAVLLAWCWAAALATAAAGWDEPRLAARSAAVPGPAQPEPPRAAPASENRPAAESQDDRAAAGAPAAEGDQPGLAEPAALLKKKQWPPPQTFRKGAVIRFEGEIEGLLQGFLSRKLAAAQAAGADLVVLDIESPGGHLHESGEIAQLLHEHALHTVAYIRREALSGAAYVALGCDEMVLHPDARLGDVGVIFLADDFAFRYAPEKIRSALVQEMRILAEAHQRPPALAEAMVEMEVEVYRYENASGGARLLSEKEAAALPDAAAWTKRELVLESQKGRFLTVSGERAVELTLAEGVASSLDEVKARYRVREGWVELPATSTDKALYVLHLWWVTGLLFLAGLVGLLAEFLQPGTCLGGLAALLCFSLFFWSRFSSGSSGWLEVLLFVLGLVFLGVEFFVLPGFGLAGVTGFGLVIAALVLACQNFVIPQNGVELAAMGASLLTVAGALAVFSVVTAVTFSFVKELPFLNRLMLRPPAAEAAPAANKAAIAAGKAAPTAAALVAGDVGRAETTLRPSGKARFGARLVEVVSTGELISAGQPIRVVAADEARIVVEAV